MPRPNSPPANPAVDSDEDVIIVSRLRRSTRSTTNSPSKKSHTKAEERSDEPEKGVQVVESSEQLENADEGDDVEGKVVLAPQSLSTRNARASRSGRNLSGTLDVEVAQSDTPVGRKSNAKDAGERTSRKRKSLSHGEPQAGVKRKASGKLRVEEDDDEVVPGMPEDRLWLHSVQIPLFTPKKQSSISDFFKPPSAVKGSATPAKQTTKAARSTSSSPASDSNLTKSPLASTLPTSMLPTPSPPPVRAGGRPVRQASIKRRKISMPEPPSDTEMDDQSDVESETLDEKSDVKSDTSDFVDDDDDAESSDGGSDSPLDSDASQDSSAEEHSDIEPPSRSSRPAKKARTSTASSLPDKLSRQALKKVKKALNGGSNLKGAHEALYPDLFKEAASNAESNSDSEADLSSSAVPSKPAKIMKKKDAGPQVKPDNWSYKNGLASHLKPICKIDDIFADMTDRALQKIGKDFGKKKQGKVDRSDSRTFLDFLNHLNGRKLRIATMCSGTESPILALNLISEALKARGHIFEFDHQFSAEIVPYKQAYIERNFSPPIIFRDIKELSIPGATHATTAYGSKAKIPGDIDILVTGFSCVDFSGLNSAKKVIEEYGESGDTFFAMRDYARIFRPKIIILENVQGAPWGRISDYMAAIGYACKRMIVDTKHYYVPHTRQRGYMMCVDMFDEIKNDERDDEDKALIKNLEFGEYIKKFDEEACLSTYERRMEFFERPASSSVEAFLLEEDDPRVIAGRAEMSKNSVEGKRRVVEWTRCQGRHEDYRFHMGLGSRRFLTNWEDGGSMTPRDYWWPDWWPSQVERIWDHMEMCYLRALIRGYDLEYKFRIIDFSQNIDRSLDTGGSGLTGCVTPTGIPYSTMRGGPLIGLEALAMQGLPVDTLTLTRESQAKLQDLAGNAMSSTVVGAAILSALIARYHVFERGTGIKKADSPPAISQTVDDEHVHRFNMNFDSRQPLSPTAAIRAANASFRACYCEGRSGVTEVPLQKCTACGHTTCVKCGVSPKHEYVKFSPDRIPPTDFEQLLKTALPMKIKVIGISIDDITEARKNSDIALDKSDEAKYKASLESVSKALMSELRFHSVRRAETWTASYQSTFARLDLVFFERHAEWRLYAKPDVELAVNDPLREALQHPIARMRPVGADLVSGQWQVWVQKTYKFEASVEGLGTPVPSFFNVVGITAASDEMVFPQYAISVPEDVSNYLDVNLSGVYTLQQQCGTSFGSLHVKTNAVDPSKKTFLFHDPDRLGDPANDFFVFSEDKRRLQHGEVRSRIARVDKKWTPLKFDMIDGVDSETVKVGKKTFALSEMRNLDPMTCYVDGQWLDIPQARFNSDVDTVSGSFSRAAEDFAVSLSDTDCHQAHVVLRCEATLPEGELSKYQKGYWIEINELEQKEFFSEYAWLTEKVRVIPGLDTWRQVENTLKCQCPTCAPAVPNMKWKLDEKSKIVPFEDPTQAAPFEQAMKDRPSALLTQMCIDQDGAIKLKLAVNPQTLLHRAAAKLLGDNAGEASLQWRLITDYVVPSKISFPPFTLKNNDEDTEAPNPPQFLHTLRLEQRRSLHWMISQEADDITPFIEEEVEEASIPLLGWRAEGHAFKEKIIRGGVLADQVGYGKTVTTLALVDSQRDVDEVSATETVEGLIPIKATLILVPSQLPDQWYSEIKKFLPKDYRVIVLKTLGMLEKFDVKAFTKADIIIVSWNILEGDSYLFKLAQFAGVLELPEKAPARAQSAWYANAVKKISENVEILKKAPSTLNAHITSNLATEGSIASDVEAYVPSKRLRGQAYQDYKEKLQLQKTRQKIAADLFGQDAPQPKEKQGKKSEDKKAFTKKPRNDVFGLKKFSKGDDYKSMKSPIFEMFRFGRVVVDEYAYVAGEESLTIANLKARAKWVLSGTPPLQDFLDVKTMSKFLGIYLGIDDFTSGVMNATNIKMMTKNMTSGEEFRTFKQKQSFAWHQNRHAHAQRFLDKFVRQNIADIEAIKGSTHHMPVILPAAERAIYLELQQLLAASDFKMMKGKKGLENDRMKRIRELLGQSESVGEALMKCASHFTLDELHDDLNNAPAACDVIVAIRKRQLEALKIDLAKTLRQAEFLHLTCETTCEQYVGVKRQVEMNHFGDVDASEEVNAMMLKAFKKRSEHHWSQFYMTQAQRDKALEKKAKVKSAPKKPASKKRKAADLESDDFISENDEDEPKSEKLLPLLPEGRNGNVELAHSALRDVTNTLRKIIIEYVSRKRCLRFFDCVRELQMHYTELRVNGVSTGSSNCSKCGESGLSPDEISILSQCGHTACDTCLKKHEETHYNNLAVKEECLVQGCNAINKQWQVIKAPELGVEDDSTRTGRHYGKKIEDIIELIHNIPSDEQILLFVQFTDLLDKIVGAFQDKNITFLSLNKGDPAETLTKFQTETGAKASRVLILNIGDASAAGSNLTNANHVIFVSPYLTDREQTYKAAMTQAVGRARRYGQCRPVHTYHFLSLKTIDVDTFESRNHVVLDDERVEEPAYAPFEGFGVGRMRVGVWPEREGEGRRGSKWGSAVVSKGLVREEE